MKDLNSMCDTMVALGNTTASGGTLFAKNSDRDANEAQAVEIFGAKDHEPGGCVQLTYIAIPQASHTHTVMVSRPYWMWGAEMGANEHGVVIGNEAILTKVAPGKTPGLIGMDMVRLGLERATTAEEALQLICSLVEDYGQSGNCGHPQAAQFYYHNSFLIADRTRAFVLETISNNWIYEEVIGIRSISNTLTIGETFDGMSDGLMPLAETLGWQKGTPFNFAEIFGARLKSELGSGPKRWRRSTACLEAKAGTLTPADMMRTLRDHGPGIQNKPGWRPDGLMNGTICAHASFGPVRRFGQSVGSQVSLLGGGSIDRHYVTGTSAPDTGIFKPLSLDPNTVPSQLTARPAGTFDTASLWWRHERLHRAVLKDYAARLSSYAEDRDRLEVEILETGQEPASIQEAWDGADRAEQAWLKRAEQISPRNSGSPAYRFHWHRLAQKAKFPG